MSSLPFPFDKGADLAVTSITRGASHTGQGADPKWFPPCLRPLVCRLPLLLLLLLVLVAEEEEEDEEDDSCVVLLDRELLLEEDEDEDA